MEKDLHPQENQGNIQEHHEVNDELLDSLKKSPYEQKEIAHLAEVFKELFGTDFLGDYTCYTNEAKQCSDWSDLYTLIKYEGKDIIVKVGAGEFNTKVFTTGNVKELKWFYHSPIPLFVVNQGNSYLGDTEDKFLRAVKPKEYLDKFAVIVSPKWWEAMYRTPRERHEQKIDFNHIHIREHTDALLQGRLALLHKTFPNWEFEETVRMIKRLKKMDFEQFHTQIRKGEKFLSEELKKLLGCLWHMWINTVGCAVGDRDAYQSLYDLIQSFDTHKQAFIKSDN